MSRYMGSRTGSTNTARQEWHAKRVQPNKYSNLPRSQQMNTSGQRRVWREEARKKGDVGHGGTDVDGVKRAPARAGRGESEEDYSLGCCGLSDCS